MKVLLMPLVVLPGLCLGQDPLPLATDRPGFSDGSNLVAPGVVQVEMGFFRTQVGRQSVVSAGDLLLRYGVNEKLELRLIGLSYGFAPGDIDGWLDPSIGFKYRLAKGDGEWTLVMQTTIPIGMSPIRTNEWNPTAKLAWTKPSGTSTWGGNLVLSRVGTGGDRFTQAAASLYTSLPLTPRITSTPEIWIVDHVSKGAPSGTFASIAATYLADPNTQFDLRIGTGFNQSRDGWFLQGGISIRF